MSQHKVDAADCQLCAFARLPFVGRHHARVLVDPRRQFFARSLKSQLRCFGIDVLPCMRIGDDFCAQCLKHLQPVDMVCVIVSQQHMTDRLGCDGFDLLHQLLSQRGRAQCINHHHAIAGDNKSRVRDEIAIGRTAQCRLPLDKVHILGNLLQAHGPCSCSLAAHGGRDLHRIIGLMCLNMAGTPKCHHTQPDCNTCGRLHKSCHLLPCPC